MTALAKIEKFETQTKTFDQSQVDLIKNTFCKGLLDEEFQLFLQVCKKTGLCPFSKQIYAVKRNDKKLGREVMTIQTSIDGYRLIADRTGCYCPGREPTFQYDKNGQLLSATSYVKKQTRDGTWHEISAIAFFSEYAQGFKDFNTGSKKLTAFWLDMPHNQLAKCAESLALRKAFPAELSGIFTKDEMNQSEDSHSTDAARYANPNVKPLYMEENQSSLLMVLEEKQRDELMQLFEGCSDDAKKGILSVIYNKHKAQSVLDLPSPQYEWIKGLLVERYKHNQAILVEKEMADRPEVEIFE